MPELVEIEEPQSPQGPIHREEQKPFEIKLIKLVPVTDRGGTGHISTPDVTTYEVSLDTDLRYVALSYVWGPEIPQVMIQVDGEPFAIRQNLASAFRQLQVLDPDARIWTDAICINQSDEKEKSRVVQHMGEIYHAAERVYAWLGPPDPGTHLGIGQSSNALWDHLQVIGNLFWRCAGPDSSLDGTLFDINHILTQALPDMTARFAKDPEHGGFPTLAYAAFSNRPYWQRVWVIQEVHLARKLVFCCGDRTMDSKTLAGALILLEAFQKHVVKGDMSADPHLREFAVSSPCYPEMHQLTLYTSIYPSDVHSLRIAMTNFCVKELPRGARATDPRDMIFGLLGFATARERPCIRVDYGKSAQETYRDATLALLQSGFTDVLAWAQPSEKIVQGLPSWVPDFSGTIYEAMCSQHQAKPWLPYFDASAGFHSASNGPKLSPGGELFWPGLVVDKVKKVGSLWYPRLQKDSSAGRVESEAVPDDMRARAATYDEILNYLCEIHSFACESIELHGGPPPGISDLIPDWREAAWRIPCADQLVFDSRPHRNHPAIPLSYESALRDIQTCLRGDGQTIASEEGRRYIETMMRWVKKRPLLCEKGYLGLVPGDTRVGDILVLLEGCSAPYVLRRKQGSEDGEGRIRYQLVGEAYVWGIMDGELTQVGSPEKLFTLV
ncbi:heterokaryon incompatibility protein-domain-containing protein [Xylariomycetidae sp. FL2044]|nr:heterokaryon incompatibility protein-domain-containing protein [Xylariomycetidae sp. FL2044]